MVERDPQCIFCSIIVTHDENIILEEDESTVTIKDIKPASKFHFLIIPKKHIPNAKCLTKEDIPLVENMVERAKCILEKNGVQMSDSKLVFHWPPFTSVQHLHLHAIAPVSDMSFVAKLVFRPNTWWCVTVSILGTLIIQFIFSSVKEYFRTIRNREKSGRIQNASFRVAAGSNFEHEFAEEIPNMSWSEFQNDIYLESERYSTKIKPHTSHYHFIGASILPRNLLTRVNRLPCEIYSSVQVFVAIIRGNGEK